MAEDLIFGDFFLATSGRFELYRAWRDAGPIPFLRIKRQARSTQPINRVHATKILSSATISFELQLFIYQ